jgi:hypothetical protein
VNANSAIDEGARTPSCGKGFLAVKKVFCCCYRGIKNPKILGIFLSTIISAYLVALIRSWLDVNEN